MDMLLTKSGIPPVCFACGGPLNIAEEVEDIDDRPHCHDCASEEFRIAVREEREARE